MLIYPTADALQSVAELYVSVAYPSFAITASETSCSACALVLLVPEPDIASLIALMLLVPDIALMLLVPDIALLAASE